MKKFFLNCDGGSRGNPGPSASGAVLFDADDVMVDERGEYLGIQTNNFAEYHAVIIGIQMALEHGATELHIRLDSMLIVQQMNGKYKIKAPNLAIKNAQIHELLKKMDKFSFVHVYREHNKAADAMVNKVLDVQTGHKKR